MPYSRCLWIDYWFIRFLRRRQTVDSSWVFKFFVKSIFKWSLGLSWLLSWIYSYTRTCLLCQVILNVTCMLEVFLRDVDLDVWVSSWCLWQLLFLSFKIVCEVTIENCLSIATLRMSLRTRPIKFTFCDITSCQRYSVQVHFIRLVLFCNGS